MPVQIHVQGLDGDGPRSGQGPESVKWKTIRQGFGVVNPKSLLAGWLTPLVARWDCISERMVGYSVVPAQGAAIGAKTRCTNGSFRWANHRAVLGVHRMTKELL